MSRTFNDVLRDLIRALKFSISIVRNKKSIVRALRQEGVGVGMRLECLYTKG